jgi:hypothetical protein
MTQKKSNEYSDEEFEQLIQDGQRFRYLVGLARSYPAFQPVLYSPPGATGDEIEASIRGWIDKQNKEILE